MGRASQGQVKVDRGHVFVVRELQLLAALAWALAYGSPPELGGSAPDLVNFRHTRALKVRDTHWCDS